MQRNPVTSSMIKSMGHDPKTNTLEVEFRGGSVYQYSGVTESDYNALISSPSVGSHFAEHIRERKQFTKVTNG